jgi:DNA-binding CsgD family transcriptional regulator
VLRRASATNRRALLAGAAGLAAPVVNVVDGGAFGAAPPADVGAVAHGLYWLTANLAEAGPLMLAVDDLHWSDPPSLRYLAYLAPRLEGLGALVVLTARPGEPGADTAGVSQIASARCARVVRPAALSEAAVSRLVRLDLRADAEVEFVRAVHEATGGIPFLVHELLYALAADGVEPTSAAAERVRDLGPETVGRATLMRLSRLGQHAVAVARAVAVLGRHAAVARVARMAGVMHHDALREVDTLAAVHILRPGRPVRFAHPILRAAVYDEMASGARSAAHGRAACMLAEEGADASEIATHLLQTEPGGAPELIGTMRDAAAGALSRGAAESAIAYLRRALGEATSSGTRAVVLHELGLVEAVVRDPRAVVDLREALRLTGQRDRRARIAHDLAEILVFAGQWEASLELIHAGLRDLGESDPDLQARLEALRALMEAFDPRFVGDFDRRLERLHVLAGRGEPGARWLSVMLAVVAALRGERPGEIVSLVERGLDAGRLLADEGVAAWPFGRAAGALCVIDDLDRAEQLTAEMLADARRRGSVQGFAVTWTVRTLVSARRGDLVAAEADLRAGLDVARDHEMLLPVLLRNGLDAILERPQLDEVAAIVETINLVPPFAGTMTGAMLLDVRGRLRLLRGQADAGIEDLRRCGEISEALRCDNPHGWTTSRPALAIALRVSAPDEAARLAAHALGLARATGLPRAQGVALRAAGLVEAGEPGIELLRQSLAMLELARAPLELARTLVELGAALRRANQRAAARDTLRVGLDAARACGAERLAARAHQELRATGARPRRQMVNGRDALTSSEMRVAQMAAAGSSNRDIAQTLFVTAKTVENQLGSTYRKLGINSRQDLPGALAAQRPAP